MSWEWLEADRIIKTCEYSDFVNNEMAVSELVESFFLGQGERLVFVFNEREYPTYVVKESGKVWLKWSKVLIRKLTEAFPEYITWFEEEKENTPKILFEKNEDKIHLILTQDENIEELSIVDEKEKTKGPVGLGLSRKLKEWIDEYPNYYPRDFRFSFKEVIQTEIPEILLTIPEISKGNYHVQGFAGDTQWAEIPWVVIKERGQSGIDSGLSMGYFLAKDSQILYLAIICQEEGAGVRSQAEKAEELRANVFSEHFKTAKQDVYLPDPLLASGTVYYKEYSENFPEDGALVADISEMFKLFEKMLYPELQLPVDEVNDEAEMLEDIEDSQEKENAAVDSEKETDAEETNEAEEIETVIEETEMIIEVMPVEEAEIAPEPESLQEKEEWWGSGQKTENNVDENQESEDSERPDIKKQGSNTELPEQDTQETKKEPEVSSSQIVEKKVFVKLEPERVEPKIKTSVIEKNIRVKQEKNLIFEKDPVESLMEMSFPVKTKNHYQLPGNLQSILEKIGSKGFYFPEELIKNFYVSLKAKSFVVLTGRMGTGKTSFPRLFAEAIGASYENGRYERILVSKEWEDEKNILRSIDARGGFVPSSIIRMVKKAVDQPSMPYFLLLDEMDQANSMGCYRLLIEGINGRDEPLFDREDFASDHGAFREYGSLIFPDNLYIIGTVKNGIKDVSPEILDSGNLIQMPEVEINAFPNTGDEMDSGDWNNEQFKMNNPTPALSEIIEKLMRSLTEIQRLLLKYHCGIGYRQKNEILAYGINSGIEELFQEDETIDYELIQRIIPWIEKQNQMSDAIYRELCLLAIEGQKFEDETIKEKLFKLSEEQFLKVTNKWYQNGFFAWPLTLRHLISARNHKR